MELKIGKTQNIWDNLPNFSPPPITDLACLHGRRPASSEVVVMMRQNALLQIDDHGRSDMGVELGGLLLGNVYQHADRLHLDIEAAISVKSDQNGPVHFTFTADAWAAAHREREANYPDLKIVGWFHTHPDLGVFYSSDDVVVHTTAFSLPWHVGLVLDPVRNTVALFGWIEDDNTQEKSLAPLQGWFEMGDTQDGSVIPWRYRHQYGLSGMRRDAMRSGLERYGLARTSDTAGPATAEPVINDGPITAMVMLTSLLTIMFMFLVYYPAQENNQAMSAAIAHSGQAQAAVWHAEETIFCPTPGLFILNPSPQQTLTVGESMVIVGRTEMEGIVRYELQARSPQSSWRLVDQMGENAGIGPIGRWHTYDFPAGEVELRLVGINGQGERLQDSACQTTVQLISPDGVSK